MKRGDIYFIKRRNELGCGAEIPKARPGTIVSSDALNGGIETVEVVYLTTHPIRALMTHVTIEATGTQSTALCEMVDHVAVKMLGSYCGTCTKEEMADIDRALLLSLGINEEMKLSEGEHWLMEELGKLKAERDRYARMLDHLLEVSS